MLIVLLSVMFLLLQWRLWVGDGGVHEVKRHQAEVSRLSKQLEEQKDINDALRAEVKDLQEGLGEIEERARSELGMIGEGETFYQFVGEKVETSPGGDNFAGIATEESDVPTRQTESQ